MKELLKLSINQWKDISDKVFFARSKKDEFSSLAGICIDLENKEVVATDAARLVVYNFESFVSLEKEEDKELAKKVKKFVIGSSIVRKINKILEFYRGAVGTDSFISIWGIDEYEFCLRWNDQLISKVPIENSPYRYPNWNIFPESDKVFLGKFDCVSLKKVLLEVFQHGYFGKFSDKKRCTFRLLYKGTGSIIAEYVTSNGSWEKTQHQPIVLDAGNEIKQDMFLTLNPYYLFDFLNRIEEIQSNSQSITFTTNVIDEKSKQHTKAVRVLGNNPEYKYYIMPIYRVSLEEKE